MKRRIVSLAVFIAALGIVFYGAFHVVDRIMAHAKQQLSLRGNESVAIECTGKELSLVRILRTKWLVTCRPQKATATPTPSPSDHGHETTPTSAPPTPTGYSGTLPSLSDAATKWHTPGSHDGLNVHEHGDKPPDWANAFSQKNFGHPVIFGGDEATPNENVLKHQAYKGFLMRASGVDVYIRYHNMSNPLDRAGHFHSYEFYAKDESNNVSFWQGYEFVGYPDNRSQRSTRRNEQPGYDSINGITWPGRDQYIVAAPDATDWNNYLRCEQWYKHAGLWSWDTSVTICGASTYYSVDEHLTNVSDRSTWKLTGDVGGSRRLEISHYGPENPLVGGESLPFDQWFCVKKQPVEHKTGTHPRPTWEKSGPVSGPSACSSGWLPQYVASTFPKKGVYFETGNTEEKDFPTNGVTVPN